MLKVKADISMKKAGSTSETSQKEEEVVLDTNKAYETAKMHYRYQSASRSRPPVDLQEQSNRGREEPVYENHATNICTV